MRVVVAVALVAGVGCGFKPADGMGHGSGDGGVTDGAIDGPVRMDGCATFSKLFDTCTMAAGGTAVSITGQADYDTMTNSLSINGGTATHPPHVMIATAEGMIDVWIASSFSLTGKLRVHGANAFGIAAEDGITLDGLVDLTDAGAGARPDNKCVGEVGLPGQNHSNHGGGGGGGALNGAGGDGMNSTTTMATGGVGGSSIAPVKDGLLGGCDGGKGADGGSGGSGGEAGDGGGAILLATANTVTLTANGAINVGGGGGHPGSDNGGAGGGGSGGTIVIEAFALQNAGAIAANGGGGGEGGDNTQGMRGQTGQASATRALGGSGATNSGGAGALGGAGATPNGDDDTATQANGGGGGGGGGAGFVMIGRATANGVISPSPIAW